MTRLSRAHSVFPDISPNIIYWCCKIIDVGIIHNTVIVTADSAQTNKLVFRYIISESNTRERLLVVVAPRWAHILSNATKWSLALIPFGLILRSCNVLCYAKWGTHRSLTGFGVILRMNLIGQSSRTDQNVLRMLCCVSMGFPNLSSN